VWAAELGSGGWLDVPVPVLFLVLLRNFILISIVAEHIYILIAGRRCGLFRLMSPPHGLEWEGPSELLLFLSCASVLSSTAFEPLLREVLLIHKIKHMKLQRKPIALRCSYHNIEESKLEVAVTHMRLY
jgi:hypothetical protein